MRSDIVELVKSGRNFSVSAAAGGGKTTLIREVFTKLQTSDNLVLTFSKELEIELTESLENGTAATLHGHMLKAIKKYCLNKHISPQVQKTGNGYRRSYVNSDLLHSVTHKAIRDFFEVDKIIPKIIASEFYNMYNSTIECVETIRKQAIDYKRSENANKALSVAFDKKVIDSALGVLTTLTERLFKRAEVDFGGMLYLPVLFPEVGRLVEKPSFLAIDESQDSNPAMIKCYGLVIGKETQVMAVSDALQCIHIWNGVNPNAAEHVRNLINATEITYRVTYRSPKCVVKWLNDSMLDVETSAYVDNAEGTINEVSYNKTLMRLSPGDALLGRFNRHLKYKGLEEVSIELLKLGKRVRFLGSTHIEVSANLLSKVSNLPKTVASVLRSVTNAVTKELHLIEVESGKTGYIYRKLQGDLRTFATYLSFYGTKKVLFNLSDYLKFLNDMYTDSDSAITLCTYHKAKGKQWSNVWVMHLSIVYEDIIDEKLEVNKRMEARNLYYVACTRTSDVLNIVDSKLASIFPNLEAKE